ncbi:MAG: hypothetical protein VYB73_03515 [Verrucomicrobiota bacterium]|nr:hypothetical protein [Verrucomicrobiota bacterium]
MKKMKELKQFMSVFLLVIAFAVPSSGEEKSKEKKSSKVATSLNGKLIGLKGGKISDAKIPADVDYYVLYHSASW